MGGQLAFNYHALHRSFLATPHDGHKLSTFDPLRRCELPSFTRRIEQPIWVRFGICSISGLFHGLLYGHAKYNQWSAMGVENGPRAALLVGYHIHQAVRCGFAWGSAYTSCTLAESREGCY